jgi:hypothetical protein
MIAAQLRSQEMCFGCGASDVVWSLTLRTETRTGWVVAFCARCCSRLDAAFDAGVSL